MTLLRCVTCAREVDRDELDISCPHCGSAVVVSGRKMRYPGRRELEALPPGVWRYRAFLPQVPSEEVVTLGEGGTPLLQAERLGKEVGLGNLLIKDETRNPTGSFIDRGSTVLVSLAKWRAMKECTCLTTGNLGASLAAYCAKAGIGSRISIYPSTDRGKLYQMLAYGAQIEVPPRHAPRAPSDSHSLSVTAGNPYLLEGEKTTGFEIAQDLGWRTPDVVVVPVGTGGHLSMIWRAITELKQAGLIHDSPCRLLGVQLEGSAEMMVPSSRGRRGGAEVNFTELEESEPYFVMEATRAIEESGGTGLVTTAKEAIRATGALAKTEGIFAEPASASVVACLGSALKSGLIRRDDTVVCVITGAGLKDTKAVSRLTRSMRRVPVREVREVARLQIGDTKLLILQLLRDGPGYGYQLWQELSRERGITTASVYQHLVELEELGLTRRSGVVIMGGRERIPYELTKKGSEFLDMVRKLETTGHERQV